MELMPQRTLKTGIHFLIPIMESARVVHWKFVQTMQGGSTGVVTINSDRIDMREHVLDFGKQHVITKDNVMIDIDALVYFRITDPKAATFNVQDLPDAIELLTQVESTIFYYMQATLRNIVAKITLDDTFSSREAINEELLEKVYTNYLNYYQIHLDAERWGVTITRVEIQNILPPYDIKNVMEMQIKSERARRYSHISWMKCRSEVLRADGDRIRDVITSRGNVARVAILEENYSQQVLNAEGFRASTIVRAEGEAAAKLMAAEAEKKSLEIIAQGLEVGCG